MLAGVSLESLSQRERAGVSFSPANLATWPQHRSMAALPPIDAAPHQSWKALSTALRLPVASLAPGQGRLTALSVAAARVQQLDAVRLDTELLLLLQMQLQRMIGCLGPDITANYKPEVKALLPALLYSCTVLTNMPTPGMALQNLRYADESSALRVRRFSGQREAGKATDDVVYGPPLPSKRQRIALGLLTVGLQYVWGRLDGVARSRGWDDMRDPHEHSAFQRLRALLFIALRKVEGVITVLSCIHHLHFLATGAYKGLAERVLSLRLVQNSPEGMQRLHMFEYMNRQLIWRGLADFGLFMMTVVDFGSLWARIMGVVKSRRQGTAAAMAEAKAAADRGCCPLCQQSLGTAFELHGCGHECASPQALRFPCVPCLRWLAATPSFSLYLICAVPWMNPVCRYCYYCLATKCPALVLELTAVPAAQRNSTSFRCLVCNHTARKATRAIQVNE
eukprot:COSAG03_NODE_55_length_16009_cov_5.220050_2_plen_452_part_00